MSEELMVYVWNKNNEQPLDKVKLNNEVIDNPLYTALLAHPITDGDRKKALELITETFKKSFITKYNPNEQGLFELEQVLDYVEQRQKAIEDALNQKIQSINIPSSKAINLYNATVGGVTSDIHFSNEEGLEIFETFQYLLGATKSWASTEQTLVNKRDELLTKAKSKSISPNETKQLVALQQIIENFNSFKNWYTAQDGVLGIEDLEAELGETQDWKSKDKSQQERASKKILNIVTGLPAYRVASTGEFNFQENRPYRKGERVVITSNLLGLPKSGDFQKNWALLGAELSGITDYNKMYEAIEKLSDSQPQFKQLLENLPNPKIKISVQNIKQITLAMGMKRIFSNPEIAAVSVDINKKESVVNVTQQIKGIKNAKNLIFQLDKQYFQYNREYGLIGENGNEFNVDKFLSDFLKISNKYVSILANSSIKDKKAEFAKQLANTQNLTAVVRLLNALGIGVTNYTYVTPNYRQQTVETLINNMSKLTALVKKLQVLSELNKVLVDSGTPAIKIDAPLGFLASVHERLFPDGKTISPEIESAIEEGIRNKTIKGIKKDVIGFLKKKETELKPLLDYFGKFDIELRPSSYLNAEDKKKYIRSPWFYMTQITNAVNKASNYEELISTPGFERFDYRKDPNVLGSIWLSRIFGLPTTVAEIEKKPLSEYKKQEKFGEPINLDIRDYNGTEIKGMGQKVGMTTTNQHPGDKVLQDFFSFFSSTEMENIRFGDKSSSFSVFFSNPVLAEKVYVPITVSGLEGRLTDPEEINAKEKLVSIMTGYLGSELKRVMQAIESPGRGTTYDKFAKNLFIFADILPKPIIDAVKGAENREVVIAAYKAAIEALPASLERYFDEKADELVDTLVKTLSTSIDTTDFTTNTPEQRMFETLRTLNGVKFINNQLLPKDYKLNLKSKDQLKYLAKVYLQNGFIHNVEFLKFFVGDLANFDKTDKDAREIFKRIPFTSSPGDAIFWDSTLENFFENDTNQDAISRAYSNVSRKFSPVVRTVIYNDVISFTSKDWQAYKDAYDSGIWDSLSESEKYEYEAYAANPKEADAQGVITLDFYRNYLISLEGWSDSQEQAYNNQVRIAQIQSELRNNPNNSAELMKEKNELLAKIGTVPFPPLKLGHYGPIVEDPKLVGLHKFSLVPLVPSMVEGKQLAQQLDLMYKNGVDYYTFKSGSKMAQYGASIDFYKEQTDSEGNQVKVVNDALSSDNVTSIHLHNLRQQQYQAPKFKEESTLATQMMKLLFGDFYEYGEINSELSEDSQNQIKGLYQEFKTSLQDLVKVEQLNLEKKLGITRNDKGAIEQLDQLKLARYLVKEFEKQDLPLALRSFIEVNTDGNLKNPLDIINNRAAIESLILNVINNKIIGQKVHGESYIQVAGTGFETRRFANPTAEQLLEFGANELQFYRLDPLTGKTLPMEVKIGFNAKKHGGLLKLPYQNGTVKDLTTLNNILKSKSAVDEAWVEEYKEHLTMVGVRIPVQGPQSMEHVIVKEFLPEASGAVMVLPAQIVVKSGGDFDIDKLTFFESAYDENGNLVKKTFDLANYKEQLERRSELLRSKAELQSLLSLIDQDSGISENFKKRKELYEQIQEIKQEIKDAIESTNNFLSDDVITEEDRELFLDIAKDKQELNNKYLDLQTTVSALDQGGLEMIRALREDLARISQEVKNLDDIKKGVSNNLVGTIKELLSMGEMYDNMTAPNNNNVLTQFTGKGNTISTTDVFNPLTSWRIYAENILSKDALGIDAKINTLQKEFQLANLMFTNPYLNQYYFKANKAEDGSLRLGGRRDQSGNRISKILSEFINGHVDIAKEDWIILLGMNEITSPLAHAMILSGTPIEDVLGFLKSEPVQQALELSDRSEIHKKLSRAGMSKPKAVLSLVINKLSALESDTINDWIQDLTQSLRTKKVSNSELLAIYSDKFLSMPEINKYITNFDAAKANTAEYDSSLNSVEKNFRDIAYLLQFGVVVAQQDAIRELTSLVDFNTSNYRTTFQSTELLNKESALTGNFNKEALDFMFNQSALAQFNVGSFTLDIMSKIFPLSDSLEVHEALNRYLEYSNIINSEKRRDAIKTYKDNLIYTHLVATAKNENGSLLEYYRGKNGMFLKGTPNNILEQYNKLQDNPDLAGNFVFNNLYAEIANDREIQFFLKNIETTEYSREYREAFLEGLRHGNPEIRKFFNDLALGSYMQDGAHFNNKGVSSIVPHEVYVNYAKASYDTLEALRKNNPAGFKDYLSLVGFATLLSNNVTGPQVMLPSFLAENYPLYINTIGRLNVQLVANFSAKQKRVFEPDAVTQAAPAVGKFTGDMTYAYGAEKRPDVTANTTFDAILSGERTATTRFEKDGKLNYWKQAKVGDVITWKAADGRTVDVVVTKELHPLKGSGKTPELWSQLEGWSIERFNKRVKPNIGQAYQIEFRLAQPIAQPSASVNPLVQAGVKPTDMAGNAAKDIQMAAESTQFIGFQSGTATVSSTNKYKKAWGDKANTGTYSSKDVIMVSGSGLFRGVAEAQIRETLTNKYKPLLEKAVAAEASFRVGNRYEKGNLSDQLIGQYLKSKGYTEQKLEGYSRWTLEKVKPSQNDINNLPNIEPCGG
jgi:hypothetical protein